MKDNSAPASGAGDWKQESGPLKPYLADKSISEIMVNRWDRIFIERNGIIEEAEYKFQNPEALFRFVQSVANYIGRELNRKYPYLDARLPDGSRLNMVIPPVAFESPTVTIRKASGGVYNYQSLIQNGSLDEKAVYFLNMAVAARQNIVISGGTGSGKTTILNVLSGFIGQKERVVSIEDTAELQINVRNLVRMETRPPLANESGITMDELLRNALRMRPDRILIGECRGKEALDMLMAMNTGHEGSMTTIHANTAADALRRLESMVLRSGIEAPLGMVQADIANTINMVIQTVRSFDGKRRVVEILEILGRDKDQYITQSIFRYDMQQGLISTGVTPRFAESTQNSKIKFPQQFFLPDFKVKLSA